MILNCIRCDAEFEANTERGYCDECLQAFKTQREHVHAKQNPERGIIADGKFAEECPQSFTSPICGLQLCGLCGGNEISPGYGLGSGYGIGSYNFCESCCSFLDFCEDSES